MENYLKVIDVKEFETYYKIQNHTVKETALHFNITPDEVMYFCSKHNVFKRGPKLKEIEASIDMDVFREYYRTHNQQDTAKYFGINVTRVLELVKKYNMQKTNEEKRNVVINTWVKNYGSTNAMAAQRMSKTARTLQDKYGEEVDTIWKIPGALATRQANIIQKYGGEEEYKSAMVKQFEDYAMKTYGVKNVFLAPEIQLKIRETCLERYGTEHPMSLPEFKDKAVATNQRRYGYDWHMQTPEYKQFLKDTVEQRLPKVWQTMKDKGSYRTSVPEENLYRELCSLYKKEDIERQYKEERYPWHCDFYIKSLDRFIELNYFWTHGKHPFDASNLQDVEELNAWKEAANSSAFWNNAVKVWSVSDVSKLNCIKENHLNADILYPINNNKRCRYTYSKGVLCDVVVENSPSAQQISQELIEDFQEIGDDNTF